jgi:translation initiation factor 5B
VDLLLALTVLQQSLIKPSNATAKSKKDKKQKAKIIDLDEGEDRNISHSASKAPVEVTADELLDEEWGPAKEKKKKDKKGKAKADSGDEDERKGLHLLGFIPLIFR